MDFFIFCQKRRVLFSNFCWVTCVSGVSRVGWALLNVKVNRWNYRAGLFFWKTTENSFLCFMFNNEKSCDISYFWDHNEKKRLFFRKFRFSSIHFYTGEYPPLFLSGLAIFIASITMKIFPFNFQSCFKVRFSKLKKKNHFFVYNPWPANGWNLYRKKTFRLTPGKILSGLQECSFKGNVRLQRTPPPTDWKRHFFNWTGAKVLGTQVQKIFYYHWHRTGATTADTAVSAH